ncbi:glycosyltransferase [Enterococcus avium]|uniref:glycosyltransferase family 2 protein n=1 Tax=Enterococcus avium TaxID=33945 RepID=UPI002892773D|nr:glycosyltransferase [Enterococcus avium]MDT2437279.1 glycosyltransferase [Enterococcus avium]MDT2466289.1 glycosyltransferase [Enterococcus avium]MDT2505638.1 glycosyltransferase [Enterococcus avium]
MKVNHYLKTRINRNSLSRNIHRFFEKRKQNKVYNNWREERDSIELTKKHFDYNPLISIIVPVFNVEHSLLVDCIESVINQTYTNWELCIADDASTNTDVKMILEYYQNRDSRIRVVYRKQNGHICKATNSALKIAKGEFIAFLDNDDFISKYALSSVIEALNKNVSYDFLYSDEDKVQGKKHFDPAFKPDWSSQLILATNYTSHFSVFRKSIVDQIGGLKDEYIGAQDYDFVLRFTEKIKNENIYHIPKVLYHWRVTSSSTASTPSAKNYANEAGKKALQAALNRRGIEGVVKDGFGPGFYQIDYSVKNEDTVTMIYVLRNDEESIIDKLQKLKKICDKGVLELFLIMPDSFLKFRSIIKSYLIENLRIQTEILYVKDENLLSSYNKGAKRATGRILFFLNDSLDIPSQNCLKKSIGISLLNNVGSVSGIVIDKRKKILSSGWYINTNLYLVPFNKGVKSYSKGYYGRLIIPTNITIGETNSFILKKNIYNNLGGFDENLNETDSIVKFFWGIRNLGFENVCNPQYYSISKTTEEYMTKRINKRDILPNNINQKFMDPFRNNEFPLKE